MTPTFEFVAVTRIPRDDIPNGFLSSDHPPGTMFMLGSEGALVKLTKSGFFMTLTPDEAFGARPVRWPNSSVLVRFDKDKLVFES